MKTRSSSLELRRTATACFHFSAIAFALGKAELSKEKIDVYSVVIINLVFSELGGCYRSITFES